MSTKAGTMGVSARPVWVPLWTTAVSALAVAALIMSAVALGLVVRADEPAALPAPREAIASGPVISGTGPGLIEMAPGDRAWMRDLVRGAGRSGYAVAGLSATSSSFIPLTPYAAYPLRP
jgi:hypothetical protein